MALKEVEQIIKESFNKFNSELFSELKKAGCPGLKAIGYATDISEALHKTFRRRNKSAINQESIQTAVDKLSQVYFTKFKEENAKGNTINQTNALYCAKEAYFSAMKNYFDISFSMPSRAILPGCFEFGKRR